MVQEAVEQRSRDDGIAKDLAPFGKAAIGGEDQGSLLVAGVDQLEEEVAATGHDRQVADLVDDQQGKAAVEADLLAQAALPLGPGERADKIGQCREVDRASRLHGLDPERQAQVALAGAGWAEEVHDFAAVDELKFGKCQDAVAIERGLEREV